MRGFFSFLIGFAVGALIGSGAAILLAPSSGEELRSQARSRVDQAVGEVKSAVEQERQRLEAELEALKRGEIKIA